MEPTDNLKSEITILVVEDEAITLEFLATTLSKKYPRYKFYKALNGKSGVELFKTHTPDIIITDINMPDMSGVQMADEIRALKTRVEAVHAQSTSAKEAAALEGLSVSMR